MNLIYNSEQYSVVEFGADAEREALRFGGFEIVDKPSRREIFIGGDLAKSFREGVEELIATRAERRGHRYLPRPVRCADAAVGESCIDANAGVR